MKLLVVSRGALFTARGSAPCSPQEANASAVTSLVVRFIFRLENHDLYSDYPPMRESGIRAKGRVGLALQLNKEKSLENGNKTELKSTAVETKAEGSSSNLDAGKSQSALTFKLCHSGEVENEGFTLLVTEKCIAYVLFFLCAYSFLSESNLKVEDLPKLNVQVDNDIDNLETIPEKQQTKKHKIFQQGRIQNVSDHVAS